MNMNLPISLMLSLLLLSGCSSEEAPPAPRDSTASGLAVGVDSLPDPCSLLDRDRAATLLGVEAVEQQSLQNAEAVSRICNYSAAAGSKVILMSLSLLPSRAMSSAVDSREELVEKATRLAGGLAPAEVLDDIGNLSFVFNQASATRLQVLTGMGALDEVSGVPNSELQLGYAINNADLGPSARRDILTALARQHLGILQPVTQ
jgi:hypothetical protein